MNKQFISYFLILLCANCCVLADKAKQKALVDSLLSGYKAANRPVKNQDSDAVTVSVKGAIVAIKSFKDDSKELKVVLQLTQTWNDNSLQWKPSEHSDVESVKIPASKIWIPDIFVKQEGIKELATVFSNGTVSLVSSDEIKAQCGESYDTTKFPRDEQTCTYRLKSPTYQSAKKLDLRLDGQELDVAGLKPSALFKIATSSAVVQNSADISEVSDDEDSLSWPEIVLSLTIARGNGEFYTHFIIFPMIVMALLTALPYAMEPHSPWKVPFACAIFVSFWVFGVLLYLVMGEAAKYALGGSPLIAICWRYNAIQSSFTIIQAAMTVDMCGKKTPPGPCLEKVVIGILAPILLCTCGKTCAEKKKAKAQQKGDKKTDEEIAMTSKSAEDDTKIDVPDDGSAATKAEKISEEWHTIAATVDRIFFLLFLIHAIVILVLYLP